MSMFMFVCSTILYEYIQKQMNVMMCSAITHVRINIHRDFYRGIIYMTNEGRNVRFEYERIFGGFFILCLYLNCSWNCNNQEPDD